MDTSTPTTASVLLATNQLRRLSRALSTLTNSFWDLRRYIFAEKLVAEESPYADADAETITDAGTATVPGNDGSVVVWSYEDDIRENACRYVEEVATAIVDELVVIGCGLLEVAETVRVLKQEGVGVEGVGELEVMLGRAKVLEVALWTEMQGRPLMDF